MSYSALRRGRHSEAGREYLVTIVTENRQPWFLRFDLARCVIGEMRRLHDDGDIASLAWVLMPDHLHWLFALDEGTTLALAMRRFKGRSARAANGRLARSGAFWQTAYHDHALRAEEDRVAIGRYVVANPVRAGLVQRAGEYSHWDAMWLEPGL